MSATATEMDFASLRSAMASVGTRGFLGDFAALLSPFIPFATFLLIRFDAGKPPVLIDGWLEPDTVPASALNDYTEATYAFDPFYRHRDLPAGGAMYRLADIAPDRFFSSEYYLDYYRRTGLCDEVGFLVPLPGGAIGHLSISRSDAMGPFRRREIQRMSRCAPVLLELLAQHLSATAPKAPAAPPDPRPPLPTLIAQHTGDRLGISLTRRECEIATLVLEGHSNASAGLRLGISRETCKVHRRNLYRKLGISSQRDLFGLLKHLL